MSNSVNNTTNTNNVTDIVYTDKTEVWCEGNSPALGHPRVFLHMDREGVVVCPYCSRRFELRHK